MGHADNGLRAVVEESTLNLFYVGNGHEQIGYQFRLEYLHVE